MDSKLTDIARVLNQPINSIEGKTFSFGPLYCFNVHTKPNHYSFAIDLPRTKNGGWVPFDLPADITCSKSRDVHSIASDIQRKLLVPYAKIKAEHMAKIEQCGIDEDNEKENEEKGRELCYGIPSVFFKHASSHGVCVTASFTLEQLEAIKEVLNK